MGGPAGLTTLLQKATLSLEELKAAARVSIAEKPDILTALPCQLPPPGSPPGLHTCSGWASSGLSLRICIHRLSPDINALELPVPHCVPPPPPHTHHHHQMGSGGGRSLGEDFSLFCPTLYPGSGRNSGSISRWLHSL